MAITKIVDDMRTTTVLDAAKVTTGTMDAARIGSGTLADDRISQASVVQHSPPADLSSVQNDIAVLALHQAINENKSAYGLTNSWIEQFENSTYITGLSQCERISSGEYMATTYSISGQWTDDEWTELLIHSDTTNGSGVFEDSSHNNHTVTKYGTITHTTSTKALGASSIAISGSNGLQILSATGMMTDTFTAGSEWTMEYWIKYPPGGTSGARVMGHYPGSSANQTWFRPKTTYSEGIFAIQWGTGNTQTSGTTSPETSATDAWVHVAVVQEGTQLRGFTGGNNIFDRARPSYAAPNDDWDIGGNKLTSGANEFMSAGNLDEIRISSTARYSGTSSFTPQSDSSADSATGTLISDTQTSSVATTKMSGVILYKDNEGTATLGTDLVISLSANGGTNYTPAASYGTVTPLFSTGVKMVRLGETTVTSGTAPVIKAVWANQASGSKETQLHGWAMNY